MTTKALFRAYPAYKKRKKYHFDTAYQDHLRLLSWQVEAPFPLPKSGMEEVEPSTRKGLHTI